MNSTDLKPFHQDLGLHEGRISASSTESPIDTAIMTSKDVVTFIAVLYFPLTIISNGVVIITATLDEQLRHSPTDFIIIALSAADFLVGAWSIPVCILDDIPETTYLIRQNRTTCIMRWFAPLFTQCMSLAMLFLLSLDRFVSVKWPLFYTRHFSIKVALFLILIIYSFEWINTYVILTFYTPFNETEINLHKRCNFLKTPKWYYGGGLTIKQAVYAIPAFFMTVEVIRILRRHHKIIRRQSVSVGVKRKELQNVKILLLLMAMFLPLWIPTMMLFFVWNYMEPKHAILYDTWVRLLRLTNSAFNSLVFAYSKKMSRRLYWFVLTNPPTRWSQIESVRRTFESPFLSGKDIVLANVDQPDATYNDAKLIGTGYFQDEPSTEGITKYGGHKLTPN